MQDDSKPLANPQLVLREEFDDWAVLFDPDTGDSFGLDPVGVFIWKLMDGKRTIGDIAAAVRSECDDAPEDAKTYIKTFIDDIVGRGLAGFEISKE
jgi:SynChlorMet cassette protein ScmD